MAPLAPWTQKSYDEIVGRLKQDDARLELPVRHRGYWHYTRHETGRQYPIHARRQGH
jgi:oligopeptidase B